MSRPDLDIATLPAIPRDGDDPVFREPWEAQVFALAVRLSEAGAFTWSEWTDALGREIAAAGPTDQGEYYWEHWLAALERLADAKGLTDQAERHARCHAWEAAARATPHGEAITLSRLSESGSG